MLLTQHPLPGQGQTRDLVPSSGPALPLIPVPVGSGRESELPEGLAAQVSGGGGGEAGRRLLVASAGARGRDRMWGAWNSLSWSRRHHLR